MLYEVIDPKTKYDFEEDGDAADHSNISDIIRVWFNMQFRHKPDLD